MAKKNKQQTYKAEVIEAFKKRSKDGSIKDYNVGDMYFTTHFGTIEYLKLVKKIK